MTFPAVEPPTRPDCPQALRKDPPMSDERTPAGPDGAVSVRVKRPGSEWRAHVPSALIYGTLLLIAQAGGCSEQKETNRKLDDLRDRVARIEGAITPRVATIDVGRRGAGGTLGN
jgi:hypothetical protein